jgi:hypothetical protein
MKHKYGFDNIRTELKGKQFEWMECTALAQIHVLDQSDGPKHQ